MSGNNSGTDGDGQNKNSAPTRFIPTRSALARSERAREMARITANRDGGDTPNGAEKGGPWDPYHRQVERAEDTDADPDTDAGTELQEKLAEIDQRLDAVAERLG